MDRDDNSATGEKQDDFPVIGGAGRNAAVMAARLRRQSAIAVPVRPISPPVLQRSPSEGEGGGTGEPAEADLRGEESDALGRDTPHERPELILLATPAKPAGPGGAPPSETATESGGGAAAGQAGPKAPSGPKQADARAVADRVYELMRQEVVLARLRGAGVSRR
jgi:hypothetical protein